MHILPIKKTTTDNIPEWEYFHCNNKIKFHAMTKRAQWTTFVSIYLHLHGRFTRKSYLPIDTLTITSIINEILELKYRTSSTVRHNWMRKKPYVLHIMQLRLTTIWIPSVRILWVWITMKFSAVATKKWNEKLGKCIISDRKSDDAIQHK